MPFSSRAPPSLHIYIYIFEPSPRDSSFVLSRSVTVVSTSVSLGSIRSERAPRPRGENADDPQPIYPLQINSTLHAVTAAAAAAVKLIEPAPATVPGRKRIQRLSRRVLSLLYTRDYLVIYDAKNFRYRV